VAARGFDEDPHEGGEHPVAFTRGGTTCIGPAFSSEFYRQRAAKAIAGERGIRGSTQRDGPSVDRVAEVRKRDARDVVALRRRLAEKHQGMRGQAISDT